jgi:hypothetical protein
MKWTKYVFLIFWAITLLSFIPSIGAGFVFDFLGWQKNYDASSFSDIINCFGYNGNHQFTHFVFYSFYKLFNIRGIPWYMFFCTLHAVNGYLLYLLIIRMIRQWGGSVSSFVVMMGVVAFLLNPYCVEVLVWKACVHYLISLMAVLAIFITFLRYLETGERKMIQLGCLVFGISLFTLEISFVTPLAISIAGLITYLTADNSKKAIRSMIIFGGILWGLLVLYLVLNKFTIGTVVGHYGAKIHLHFDLIALVSTEMKYLVKHIFYARFYTFHAKNILFDQILSYPVISFFSLSALLTVVLLHFIKIRRIAAEWHVAFFGFFASILYILPIANIYFYHLHIGMNDRYSYIPIAFLTLAFVAILTRWPRWISYPLIAVLIALNLFLQQHTLKYWHQSTEVLTALKQNFRWHDAPYVFILNSPDNMKGIVMSSIINEPSGIHELIDYQTPRKYTGTMIDVFQFNMTTPNDGVKVEQVGPMQLKVIFNQWGNWWHRNGIGATSYENEYYKAETLDFPYLLTFKHLPEGSVIIYQDGKEWKEFRFTENESKD